MSDAKDRLLAAADDLANTAGRCLTAVPWEVRQLQRALADRVQAYRNARTAYDEGTIAEARRAAEGGPQRWT